jgi:glycosyltransferase involved in cell wall biosynthesis
MMKSGAQRPLRILFYAPFKPLGHAHPSGDLVTAAGIADYLAKQGHAVIYASSLRCRWIYWKPWRWLGLISERQRVRRQFANGPVDLWFTYHSYYKAPDLLGPPVSEKLGIPYVIFQGIYSTKRRRRLKTRLGFYLNRRALCAARHVFTNKKIDLLNLKRLLPDEGVTYIAPGLVLDDFCFDAEARNDLRRRWNIDDDPVVLSAAMFRPGVKTEGLTWVIRTCGQLLRQGRKLRLVIAGDGKEKAKLHKLAREQLPDRVRFLGEMPRSEMRRFYSSGDIFVFPGINESLGMVFIEAQSCGLPVVAFANAGVPEAVQEGKTGFLVPMYDSGRFAEAIGRLLADEDLRRQMGKAGRAYVRRAHDLNRNYRKMEAVLKTIVAGK